jgi:hypothetical protein
MDKGLTVHRLSRLAYIKKPITTDTFHEVSYWFSLFERAFNIRESLYN